MIQINLLPVREARRKADLRQQMFLIAGAMVGALALTWAVHSYVSHGIDQAQTRVTQLQAQLKQYEPQKAELEQFKQKKAEIQRKLDAIERLQRSRFGPVHVMDELAKHMPDRIWLTDLRTEGDRIELEGMSLDNELVALLLTALEKSPYFGKVELQSTELKEVNELKLNTFRVQAAVVLPDIEPSAASDDSGQTES